MHPALPEIVGQAVAEGDRVPVLLVHVPARFDLGVEFAQQQGQLGFALEVQAQRLGLPVQQGKHLAGDAIDQDLWAEGVSS